MKKDTKTICLYGVAVALLLVGLFIPHFFGGRFTKSVSYTHLTLPTICSV